MRHVGRVLPFRVGASCSGTIYIHSLGDSARHRHVLGEAEILERIGENLYLAEYNGVRCTAIFNLFVGRYFVDDVYGVQRVKQWGK